MGEQRHAVGMRSADPLTPPLAAGPGPVGRGGTSTRYRLSSLSGDRCLAWPHREVRPRAVVALGPVRSRGVNPSDAAGRARRKLFSVASVMARPRRASMARPTIPARASEPSAVTAIVPVKVTGFGTPRVVPARSRRMMVKVARHGLWPQMADGLIVVLGRLGPVAHHDLDPERGRDMGMSPLRRSRRRDESGQCHRQQHHPTHGSPP